MNLIAVAGACVVPQVVGEGSDEAEAGASTTAPDDEMSTGGPGLTTTGPHDTTTGAPDPTTDVDGSGGQTTGGGSSSGPSTEAGDGTNSSSGDSDEIVIGASVAPTPDRTLLIYKADFGAGTCTRLRLETPASPGPPLDGITTPDYYNIYAAEISQEPDDCDSLDVPMMSVEPMSGSGTISWDEEGPSACPADVQVDVTLDYPPKAAWVPDSEVIDASIDVDGCP